MSLTRIADQIAARAQEIMAANPGMDLGEAMKRASREIQQENQERARSGAAPIEPLLPFDTRVGVWAPPGSPPTWGVVLLGEEPTVCGFWFGQANDGKHPWIILAPDGKALLLRDGVPAMQTGTWSARREGDGLDFVMEVPRGWTHSVDFSPSPATTVFSEVMARVV